MTDRKKKSSQTEEPIKNEGKRIMRRLQGEDGFDVFADRQHVEEHTDWLRKYEEDRR